MGDEMKLGSLAEIKVGLIFSRKEGTVHSNNFYRALTVKSVGEDGSVDDNELQPFKSSEKLDGRYLAKAGDVAIRLTPPYTAAHIEEQHRGILIPSHFALISLKDTSILLSEFLAVFLNSDYAKKKLERLTKGGASLFLKVPVISGLEIMEIPAATQQKIIELNRLHRREKGLYQRLMAEKDLFYQETVTRIMK